MVDLRTTARTSAGPSGSKRNKGMSQSERMARMEEKLTHLASSADLERVRREVIKVEEKISKDLEKVSHEMTKIAEKLTHEVEKIDTKYSHGMAIASEKLSHEVTKLKVWILAWALGGLAVLSWLWLMALIAELFLG